MPTSNLEMIRKLQIALNSKGYRILFNRSQFYSEEQKRPVTMYKVLPINKGTQAALWISEVLFKATV